MTPDKTSIIVLLKFYIIENILHRSDVSENGDVDSLKRWSLHRSIEK